MDKALRKALEEARKVLKAVAAMLKQKLGTQDKDVRSIQESMQKLDQLMSQSVDSVTSVPQVYIDVGGMGDTGAAVAAVAGGTVNTQA